MSIKSSEPTVRLAAFQQPKSKVRKIDRQPHWAAGECVYLHLNKMKLFVGKLSYSTTNESLSRFFDSFGPILSCKVITDPQTGQSRGFGFVEISDSQAGQSAIDSLNGTMLDGREVVVNEARPQTDRGGSGGFGGGPRRDSRGGNGGGRGSYGGGRGGYSGGNRY